MLGGIFGDKAGSLYEYDQLKEIKPINPKELILPNSFYSDDTIETISIMDAIINNKDYDKTLKEYILKYENYKPNHSPYFKTSFSPNTIKWAKGLTTSNSIGNGAMMRISPIGYLFNNEEEVIENSYYATIPSHNSKEAISSATTVALMIYYFRNGLNKKEVYDKLNLPIEYKPFTKFNTTCEQTINNCLYAIYKSNSFEETIRNTLLMGGDTDTNCCITGSVAESIYGMNEEEANLAQKDLPDEFNKILIKVYKYKKN